MAGKTKTFDCVEMKHRAQRALRAEYEARKDQFSSYSDFLNATMNEDEWERRMWARIRNVTGSPTAKSS